jgi:uncharacterized membrane protein YphA (DoxX/SURF4 family)
MAAAFLGASMRSGGPAGWAIIGFWSMMHEARTDFCMLFGSLYLLIAGAGRVVPRCTHDEFSPDPA